MKTRDPFLAAEAARIGKIVSDETWLEGERRHEAVSPADPAVVARVCDIVMRIGAKLREECAGADIALPRMNRPAWG